MKKYSISEINVIIVIDSLDGGGAEHQALMLADGLNKKAINTTIFTLRGGGLLAGKAKNLNLRVIEGSLHSKRNIKGLIDSILLLYRTIRSSNPVIVHTYLPLSNFLGSFVAKISGAKYIITSRRGLIKLNYLKKRWRFIDRLSNFFSNKITVNSYAIKEEMKIIDSVDINKIACIRNGVDLNNFQFDPSIRDQVRDSLGLASAEFAWIKVANFSSIKGHEVLIRGFNNIKSSVSSKLFFVGDDRGTLSKLQELVKILDLDERIEFLGFQKNVPKILLAMDGFICASYSEGLSNAILEAMTMELPIIATNVGGNPELLENEKYGILIEAGNEINISDSMKKIMEDNELRSRLSNACRIVVNERYSKESMVNSYINLYKSGVS